MVRPMTTASEGAPKASSKSSIRETLISIIISFAMAFVFRGFVIEAFLIPTGSMAPTLLGAHVRWQGRMTGYSWPSDTRDMVGTTPKPFQGTADRLLKARDPMSGEIESASNVPTRWGDRIFVMKYLYSVYEPERFDIVVFKNPTNPTENYIKRLIGLPGEQIALVDGDVFVRHPVAGEDESINFWLRPGWAVARKPERSQRAMWQDVFTSELAPQGMKNFNPPWRAAPGSDPAKWEIGARTSYKYSGTNATALAWDWAVSHIDDDYPYNQQKEAIWRYPVSDIRMSLGIRPERADSGVSAVIVTRRHEFRADIIGTTVTLKMKRYGGPRRDPNSPAIINDPPGEWVELGKGTLAAPLAAGVVTNLDFWHADQRLTMYVNDAEVAHAEYNWSPAERIAFASEMTAQGAVENGASALVGTTYTTPEVRWEFSGGPLELYRVSVQRDIHYRPDTYHSQDPVIAKTLNSKPARATHPSNTPVLTSTQYFMCGDNSPSSLDGRLWDRVSPWVAAETDDDVIGVVHRDLIIGKAFWVYFPAPTRRQGIPIPDFGRMRFIW